MAWQKRCYADVMVFVYNNLAFSVGSRVLGHFQVQTCAFSSVRAAGANMRRPATDVMNTL